MRVKITVHVPKENADDIRQALGDVGAGVIGGYSFCSFTTSGIGRFKPGEETNPHIGSAGNLEEVEEESIEVVCEKAIAKDVIEAIKTAHPYEEAAFEIIPVLDESDL